MTPESHHPQPQPRSRPHLFRGGGVSSPKHFLTWSATAANHKFQKLSKHLAQNVSRLQDTVDKVLHPPQPPSSGSSTSDPSSSSRNCPQHDHLLSVNNVHVAVVHNLSVSSRGQSLRSKNKNEDVATSRDWKTFSRSRLKLDGELQRKKLGKSCGEGLDIFEMTPLTLGSGDRVDQQGNQLNGSPSQSPLDHDTSVSSGISYGASTVTPLSPHWSRASSLTSRDTILLPDEQELEGAGRSSISLNPVGLEGKPGVVEESIPSVRGVNAELSVRILEEEPELRLASWFHAGIPREIALEVLKGEALGSFIVRESSSRSGCFALSLRVPPEFQPSGIAHYLIIRRFQGGYKIKGFTKEHPSLTSLITHHSVMPELLPCPLYRPAPPPSRVSRANSSDFVEPEKLLISPEIHHHWKYTEF